MRISEGDLRDYYKEKLSKLQLEYEVEASHIVLSLPENPSPEERAKQRDLIQEILSRARAGEEFSELARQFSVADGAERGGGLGRVRRGSLPEPLERLIFSLSPAEIGGPVETSFGLHLVKVQSRRALPKLDFEANKGELKAELRERRLGQEIKRWIEVLKEKAFVEIRLPGRG